MFGLTFIGLSGRNLVGWVNHEPRNNWFDYNDELDQQQKEME